MGVVSYRKEGRGRKSSDEKQIIIDELINFYNKHYLSTITQEDLVCDDKLSYILKNYECVDIVKNINNNIKEHFIGYVRKYVNNHFDIDDLIKKINNTKITLTQKKNKN